MEPSGLAPGDKLGDGGRYVIERALARGGMGAVYVARDAKFPGVKVAVKVAFPADPTVTETLKARFRREAQIGNLLGHAEGFVRAFDWGETADGSGYLAMDLIADAKPLDLATGSVEARVGRLVEAARLVARAHEKRVIHRDLKPANYLVAGDGTLWLTDFGLAKLLEPGVAQSLADDSAFTLTGMSGGTPPFMPPEQFEDLRSTDERADVYALGVMLYMALTNGAMPFTGNLTAIIHQQQSVLDGRRPLPTPRTVNPDLPPELVGVCLRAMTLKRADRTATAKALVEQLVGAMRGGATRVDVAASAGAAIAPRHAEPAAVSVRPVKPPSSAPVATPVSATPVAPPSGGFKLWHGALLGCTLFMCLGFGGIVLVGLAAQGSSQTGQGTTVRIQIVCSEQGQLLTVDGVEERDTLSGGPLYFPVTISLTPGPHALRILSSRGRIEDHTINVSTNGGTYPVRLGQ
jgi:serine/threonine-protein kinase